MGKFDEAFLLFEKLSKQMMIDACFISFFFSFATKQQTAKKERVDRSIDRSKEAKGTFSLPLLLISFLFARFSREREYRTIYHQIDDVYLFFCFSRHHDRDKNDRDEKRCSEGEEEMVSAQSEFVR